MKRITAKKEEDNTKREEWRHQEKEGTMVEFLDLQNRALKVKEINVRLRVMEVWLCASLDAEAGAMLH
jgi:hypothetical protein